MSERSSIYPEISERIVSTILSSSVVLVIGHANPDGDCICSSLAMGYMLRQLGKEVHLFNAGPFRYKDLMRWESLFEKEATPELLAKKPLVIVVDCSTADRPGEIFQSFLPLEKIVFDHHSAGEPFTDPDLQYIIPSSISTTLVLEKVRERLGIPLTKELAEYLYYGFVTDSGFYHYVSETVGGESLRLVSRFVDAGVSPYIMYDQINDGQELSFCKAAARVMERTTSEANGQILYSWCLADEEEESKTSDFLYAQLLKVTGVRMVFFFKEKEDAVVVGMRSKNLSGIDVGAFASLFGGGGHRYAAGATVPGTLAAVKAQVLEKAKALLQ